MSAEDYSTSNATLNAGLISTLGVTNNVANNAQFSSPEPLSFGQYQTHPELELVKTPASEDPPTDTSGSSARAQTDSTGVAPTVTKGPITASAFPMVIEEMSMWAGRIVEIDEDGIFTAELTPLHNTGPIVLGDFNLADLDADDPSTVHEGDLFYLSITKTRRHGRRVTRNSDLLLRRFGRWSSRDISTGVQEARAELTALEEHVD
jgi:hypothetical protein